MSNIEKIRQEIERRKKLLTPHKGQGVILYQEIIKQFDSLLSFIDTISQPIMKDDIIDEIRSEIERRFSEYNHDSNHHIQAAECASILAFIDSLPEETSCIYDTNGLSPTPSVSIEDVARVQFASHAHVFDRKRKAVFDWEQFKEVAGIFYGFGKRDSLPEETCKESLQVQETCKENQDSFTNLEEAAKDYAILPMDVGDGLVCIDRKEERAFIAGAKWMESQMPMPEDTVIFMKGVAEGRRLEREDRNDDKLPRYYGD